MKFPKIAIVGRPNVGKSLLFNRICNKRIAIVEEEEGVTRDRIYARASYEGQTFEVIDTGGIDSFSKLELNEEVKLQASIAIEESDIIIMVVDGKIGLTKLDEDVAKILFNSKKEFILAVNKIDSPSWENQVFEFQKLGIKDVFAVSAEQKIGINKLLDRAIENLKFEERERDEKYPFKIAILGRANVGKSTLLNTLISEKRAIESPVAGTTRDPIDIRVEINNQPYIFIDTAGIKRKAKERSTVEKFASIRTHKTIEKADLCLLVLDADEGITVQDRKIMQEILDAKKGCIIIFNKWDLLKEVRMEHYIKAIQEKLPFFPILAVSAKFNRNVTKIFSHISDVLNSRKLRISTGKLNKFIEKCITKYHPPIINNKRLKIYYLTQLEDKLPRFILFVNYPNLLTPTYKKYLLNQFRTHFNFIGTPIVFEIRGKAD